MVPGTEIEPWLEPEVAAIKVELGKVEEETPHCL
jgi:hypothetical protein